MSAMSRQSDTTTAGPPPPPDRYDRCARCRYALRGLPAEHACPECGLRYDTRSETYPVRDPRRLVAFAILIFVGGWINLKNLPHLAHLSTVSTRDALLAMTGVLWIICVVAFAWLLIRRLRRGFQVAVTADGLVIVMPAESDQLIPWADIASAEVVKQKSAAAQVVKVAYRNGRTANLGGLANVFPTRELADRFVHQVTERIAEATPTATPPPQAETSKNTSATEK